MLDSHASAAETSSAATLSIIVVFCNHTRSAVLNNGGLRFAFGLGLQYATSVQRPHYSLLLLVVLVDPPLDDVELLVVRERLVREDLLDLGLEAHLLEDLGHKALELLDRGLGHYWARSGRPWA